MCKGGVGALGWCLWCARVMVSMHRDVRFWCVRSLAGVKFSCSLIVRARGVVRTGRGCRSEDDVMYGSVVCKGGGHIWQVTNTIKMSET